MIIVILALLLTSCSSTLPFLYLKPVEKPTPIEEQQETAIGLDFTEKKEEPSAPDHVAYYPFPYDFRKFTEMNWEKLQKCPAEEPIAEIEETSQPTEEDQPKAEEPHPETINGDDIALYMIVAMTLAIICIVTVMIVQRNKRNLAFSRRHKDSGYDDEG